MITPAVPLMSTLALVTLATVSMQGCGHSSANHGSDRPQNQVAVLTVWAEGSELETTVEFYEDVLELRRVGASTSPYVLDTDGTFLTIMEGQLDSPTNTQKRWPMFALTVPDLDKTLEKLRSANVELPWGVEEFGAPNPSSRYVMFNDPAGNLIEVVEWL